MDFKEALKDPKKIIFSLGMKGKLGFITDEKYLKLMYWANIGKRLNLENPVTFNEKLQWLKLHNQNPEYSKMVDKYEAKKWVAERIGDEYIIPTLGVWDSFDEIDFNQLPNQFVLKCTHDSGGLVICKDKNHFDKVKAKKKIEASLKRNYFLVGREYPYKAVKPRIIAEQYMEDTATKELRDYKIFTFDSIAKALFISSDRQSGQTTADYFDINFKSLDFTWGYPHSKVLPSKPKSFDQMVKAAECLAKDTEELRVDFYEVNGKAYFGEMTFFDGSGFDEFHPEEWDKKFGDMIKLPEQVGGYAVIHNGWVLWCHKTSTSDCLTDYKFFCFDGIPKIVYVGKDKADDPRTDFFDMDYKHLPIRMRDPNAEEMPKKPELFEQMKSIAAELSRGVPHLRVDFYLINGHIYVGELTFYHCSGFAEVKPEEWNLIMGNWIKI